MGMARNIGEMVATTQLASQVLQNMEHSYKEKVLLAQTRELWQMLTIVQCKHLNDT